MERCNPNEDRTSESDEDQNDWDKELIHAVGMKIGRVEKDPEKVRVDRINVCLDEGANINVQDYRNGDTVLHVAVRKDYQKIVKLVLQRGARTDITNDKGYTAVRLAEILKKTEIESIFKGLVDQRSRSSTASGSMSAADYPEPSTSKGSDTVALRRSTAHFHSSEQEEKINETPGIVGSKTYLASDTLTRSWSGIIYQWQYLEFTLHCAFQAGHKFDSATEMIGVGKLDDVVLFYKNHEEKLVARFVQLKYNDKCKISPDELFKDNSDYSISDYLMSWLHIVDNKPFRDINIINMILSTTKGLDVENLRLNQIYCDIAEDPDKTFELNSDTKETACYRFSPNKKTNKKLYLELRGCVSRKLAKRMVKCIYKNEIMRLDVDSFRDYHLALTKYVFIKNNDTKAYEFRRNFIENDNLSPRVERFRQRFLFAYREMAKLPEKLHSEESVWKDIKERFGKLAFRRDFGESPKVPNPCAKSELPDDIDDTTISMFLKDFTLVIHAPGKTELDAIINRKIRDHNQCSVQRADQIGSAFWTKIQKFLSVEDNKGNEVNYLSHKVCKQLLDDIKHKVDSPNELLRKPVVKFQGYETCFGKLLDIRDSYHLRADELEDFVNMVDSRTVFKIILGEEIRIGEGLKGIKEMKNKYINRTIYRHVVLKKDIFYDKQIPDLLAISGIDEELEGSSVFFQMKDTLSAIEYNLTHLTILKSGREDEQFRALCVKNPRRNIHWLKYEAEQCIWKQSQGDITYLFKYRDSSESGTTDAIHLSESDIAAHCKPIIISDTAGMGKSTLLIYLAEKIKKDEPDLLVLQIDLIKHTAALDVMLRKKTSHDLGTINGAVQFLINELLGHGANLDREVFKRLILKQRKVALIVDGFDDISPAYHGIVIDFLQALSDYGIKKLFVTTRPDTRRVLEMILKRFAHAITPLSSVDQDDLFTKFWTSKVVDVNLDAKQKILDRARMTAKTVMNDLADIFGDYHNKLTAIPFYTKTMAEIFIDGTMPKFIDLEINQVKELNDLFPNNVFDKMVEMKIELSYREKCKRKDPKDFQLDILDYKTYVQVLKRECALSTLSGEDKLKEWLSLQEDEIEMLDIIEKAQSITHCVIQQSFMNPLFTTDVDALICMEYCAADFFTEILIKKNSNERGWKISVAYILVRYSNEKFRKMINYCLQRENKNGAMGDQSWEFYLNKYRGELNETVFHVAASENNLSIIIFFLNCLTPDLLNHKTFVNAKDSLGRTAVHLAVNNGHLEPIKLLVERGNFKINSQDSEGATPLYRAASLGKLKMVKYLLDKNANINSDTKEGMTPLDGAFFARQWAVVDYLCTRGAYSNFSHPPAPPPPPPFF